MVAEPGEVLLDKYRVEAVIGVGGMGRVVRAQHLFLDQPVAIKVLLPKLAENGAIVERFLREAQATVRLRNEHIARVMDVGTLPPDGAPYMVMEFLEGFNLNQILRHHGPQAPQAVVDLMMQACEGISEAHAIGIVHRDLKPSNFFITRRPDGTNLLKILDFGISKLPEGAVSELTNSQTVVGTPTYMAPEQMRTARSTDPRSDIWALGVVMYQMLAGRRPFEAETYAELVLKVGIDPPAPLGGLGLPAGLENIILRCLEKHPGARLQNVGELARAIAPYASEPALARQSAERVDRILKQPKTATLPLSEMTVGSTPSAAITAPSWQSSSSIAVQNANGQISASAAARRKTVIVGSVAAMCIGAAVAGFFVASAISKGGPAPAAAQQPQVQPQPVAQPQPAKPQPQVQPIEVPPPAPAIATTGSNAGSAAVAKSPPAPTTAPAKAHVAAKPKPPSAPDDDLFNTRH